STCWSGWTCTWSATRRPRSSHRAGGSVPTTSTAQLSTRSRHATATKPRRLRSHISPKPATSSSRCSTIPTTHCKFCQISGRQKSRIPAHDLLVVFVQSRATPVCQACPVRYGYLTTLGTKPGHTDDVVALLLGAADGLRAAGCAVYAVNTAADDPNTIWVYE